MRSLWSWTLFAGIFLAAAGCTTAAPRTATDTSAEASALPRVAASPIIAEPSPFARDFMGGQPSQVFRPRLLNNSSGAEAIVR
jgi:hypothetical protein